MRYWILVMLLLVSCSRTYAASPTAGLPTRASGGESQGPAATQTAGGGNAAPTASQPPGRLPSPTAAAQSPAPANLDTFRMIDTMVGWGTGSGAVLRSADGGKTWADVTPEGQVKPENPQLFAASARSAWTIWPDPTDLTRGFLNRTFDSGKTWDSQVIPFGGGTVQFLSGDKVFVMADRGVAAGSHAVDIFRSGDAGYNWTLIAHIDPQQPVEGGLPFGGDKSGITFLDDARGWLSGAIPKDGFTYLYATADGGKTWKQVQLPLASGLEKAQLWAAPPVFFKGVEGRLYLRAPGEPGAVIFYASHDSGKSWSALPVVKSSGLVSIATADDLFVWDGGKLHASHDGGKSFQELAPNVNLAQKIAGFQFVDALNGWALGMEAGKTRLYRSVDGGKTWQ